MVLANRPSDRMADRDVLGTVIGSSSGMHMPSQADSLSPSAAALIFLERFLVGRKMVSRPLLRVSSRPCFASESKSDLAVPRLTLCDVACDINV